MNQSKEYMINLSVQNIRQTILENQQKTYNFSIINIGQETADNLYFSFNQEVFEISPSQIEPIQPNNSQEFNLSLKRTTGDPILENILISRSGSILTNMEIDISFTTNETQITNSSKDQYYCSELNGKFCSATETCSTQTIQSLDGPSCCTGTCQVEEKSSNSWIAYVSIILVLIILVFVYLSYRKNKFPKLNKPSPLSAPPLRRPI